MTEFIAHTPRRLDGSKLDTVVVALDGSPYAERALPAAIRIADRLALAVGIVRVVDNADELVTSDSYLADVRARQPEVTWQESVVNVNVSAAILSVSEQRHGLLCLASHGHNRVVGAIIGSTASTMMQISTEPILFIGSGCDTGRIHSMKRLVVPLDDVTDPDALIQWASRWADTMTASLHVIVVAEKVPEPITPDDPARRRFGHADPETYIVDVLARHSQPNLQMTGEVLYDPISPVSGLSQLLRDVPDSLIVMTTRAEGGFDRLLHGTTAGALLQESPVPLLITSAAALAHSAQSARSIAAVNPVSSR